MKSQLSLRILLVLSFIYATFTMLGQTIMATMMPTLDRIYQAAGSQMPGEFMTLWNRMVQVPRLFYAVMALFYAVEIVGLVLMWRLRRVGFHCYTIASLLQLVFPLLFLGKGYVGLGDVMFVALFVALYYMQLRQLGVFGSGNDQQPEPPQPQAE